MESAKNQREVENRLRDALRYDRARVQLGKISRFGLMELSRQRLRPALAESAYIPCPRCHGIGHIRGTESTALHILRIIQEEAMKDNTAQVVAQVPVDVATFLLNEKRTEVLTIETRFKVNVLLVPNRHLETPNYSVERLRHDDLNQGEPLPPSFEMVEQPDEVDPVAADEGRGEGAAAGSGGQGHHAGAAGADCRASCGGTDAAGSSLSGATEARNGERGWLSRMLHWFRTPPASTTTAPSVPAPSVPARERPRDARPPRNRDGSRDGRPPRSDGRRDGPASSRRAAPRSGSQRWARRRIGRRRSATGRPSRTARLAKVAKTTTCAKDARASSAKAARTASGAMAARSNAKAGRRNRRHRVPLVNRRSGNPRKTSSKPMQRSPPRM